MLCVLAVFFIIVPVLGLVILIIVAAILSILALVLLAVLHLHHGLIVRSRIETFGIRIEHIMSLPYLAFTGAAPLLRLLLLRRKVGASAGLPARCSMLPSWALVAQCRPFNWQFQAFGACSSAGSAGLAHLWAI